MDRPALSPAAWSTDSQALAYSSDQRLWVYTLDRGEKDIAPAEAVTAGAWSRPLNLLALIDRGIVWTLRPAGTDRPRAPLPEPAGGSAWGPGGAPLCVWGCPPRGGQARAGLWLGQPEWGVQRNG